MKIAVLVKQVPDTETKIEINAESNGIQDSGIKYILNPYDEFAVEEAIKIGGDETTVITMGPERCVEALRTALAMGIQKAIHIDTADQNYDSFASAKVLSGVLKEGGYDLILCGKQAIDGDNGQTVQMVAEFLNAPQVMIVENLEISGDKAKITRRVGGGKKEIYETGFPLVLGAEKGLNTPRYASLPGIMKAKSKPIDKKQASDFLDGEANLITLSNYQLPAERGDCKMVEGEPADQAASLVKLLREEAKVI